MARHLADCAPKHDPAGGARTDWIRLRIEGGGPFWLDVEARADATLKDLDAFLRRAWLECCGHMSAFYIAGGRDEYPKRVPVSVVFGERRNVVRYEYDFGSTTELRLRALAARAGRSGKARVRLLARNEPPSFTCDECGQPATQICPFWEGDNPFVCDAHADGHGPRLRGRRLPPPGCQLPAGRGVWVYRMRRAREGRWCAGGEARNPGRLVLSVPSSLHPPPVYLSATESRSDRDPRHLDNTRLSPVPCARRYSRRGLKAQEAGRSCDRDPGCVEDDVEERHGGADGVLGCERPVSRFFNCAMIQCGDGMVKTAAWEAVS